MTRRSIDRLARLLLVGLAALVFAACTPGGRGATPAGSVAPAPQASNAPAASSAPSTAPSGAGYHY